MITAGALKIPEGDDYFARMFTRTGDKFQEDLFLAALTLTPNRRIALDIGAHVGSWTRMLAEHFREVNAFEPCTENYDCLVANTQGLMNFVARFNVALGNTQGYCEMGKHGSNSGCWRVIPGGAVRITRLDAFGMRNIDLIKIDVEGFEGAVIQGGVETIRASRPTVVFEDNGLGQKLYGDAWVDPKTILSALGYRKRQRLNKDEIWTCA